MNIGHKPRLPGEGLDTATMPGYWMLVRIGKRVLRPGGRRVSRVLLEALRITPADAVVELAPGMGATTRLILEEKPREYTGIERDRWAADIVGTLLTEEEYTCQVGTAQETGLADAVATVVVGEAFLSMQPDPVKEKILAEAFRILRPGGRYGLHELALSPDTLGAREQDDIRQGLSAALHVGARPLSVADWRSLLERAGFEIENEVIVPMGLLSPRRVIEDEGALRALKILAHVLRNPVVRTRVGLIRTSLARHREHLRAIALVATRPT